MARNADLEAAIVADPSDASFAVYADWLQEQGDIRGELAALQARGLPDGELLAKHATDFYGPLAPFVGVTRGWRRAVEPTWRAGWLDAIVLGAMRAAKEQPVAVADVTELVRLLPDVASARFLRELAISRPYSDREYSFGAAVKAVAQVMPQLPLLRRLTVGQFSADDSEISWSYLGSLAPLWPHASRLECLKLRAGSMDLGTIALPACRELRIETGGFARENLQAILDEEWPHLETLSIWFGRSEYGATCQAEDVLPILDGAKFPRLRHLGLKNAEWGNELAPLIVASKILPRLATLDVSMSHLTPRGLEVYRTHRDALAHLEHLDLERCLLADPEARAAAATLAKAVKLDRQRDPADYEIEEDGEEDDPGYRYAAVGE